MNIPQSELNRLEEMEQDLIWEAEARGERLEPTFARTFQKERERLQSETARENHTKAEELCDPYKRFTRKRP